MENAVWYGCVMRDDRIGDQQGLAVKWFGRDWNPPTSTGEFHIWKPGARKAGFRSGQSPKSRPFGIGLNIMKERLGPWPAIEKDDIAVSAAAVAGPTDVWCVPTPCMSLFFADPDHAAIGAARVNTGFEFRRCRLV